MNYIEIALLGLLIISGIAASVSRNLMVSLIIFMAYSVIMSVIWAFLRAQDLSITEAAVGAGISSVLMFITLKKLRDVNRGFSAKQEEGSAYEEETETP